MSFALALLACSLGQIAPGRIDAPARLGGQQFPTVKPSALPSDSELARITVTAELLRLVRQLDADAYADRAAARAAIVARRPMPDELMAVLLRNDLPIEVRHAMVAILTQRIITAPRGALGVRMEQFVERVGGVRVSGLVPGMPAEKQLVVGDVVRSVEGIPLTNSLDLTRAVQSLPPGLEVKLSVRRVKRDAAGKALVDGEGLELTEDINIGLRLGSTDDLLEKGDALGSVANAVSMERQGAAADAARRFLPKLRVVEFPQRAAVTDAVVTPTTIDSVRAMLMELQLAGGDAELVRIHRQRLDFLAQQMALVKDEHTRRGFQATLEALATEIRGSF